MKKTLATIIKEWILMKRDVAGLMLLIIMPAILIIVMALVQDAPFRDYQEMRFDLLLADNDNGQLATEIKNGLKQSKNFRIIDSTAGHPLTEQELMSLLQKGTYKVGIVIPKGATAEVVNAANKLANHISTKLGIGSKLPEREARDNMYVRMYFDPVSKPTFRTSIYFALDKYVTYSCSNVLMQRMSQMSKLASDTTSEEMASDDFKKTFQGIGVKEEPLNNKGAYLKYVNSVQHNVPAWAIFGMFFIIIPIAGHIIRERDEGSALRVALIPNAHLSVAMGKIIFYTIVCSFQFICMLCIGIWVLPLLGLPSLYLGLHPFALLPVAIAIGFAATSYGYFVGTMFKTTNQALPFGAISIVIFAAIGGIWVPVELLQPMMQRVALLSPLHWGLDAVHALILRNGSILDVWTHILVLFGFGIILWGISTFKNVARNQSGGY